MRFTPFHPGHSENVTQEEENSLPAARHRDRVSPGKGLSPGATISALLCKRESRAGTFFSHCFLGEAKLPCSASATPIQERGLCAACARARSATARGKRCGTSTYAAVTETAAPWFRLGTDTSTASQPSWILTPKQKSSLSLNRASPVSKS